MMTRELTLLALLLTPLSFGCSEDESPTDSMTGNSNSTGEGETAEDSSGSGGLDLCGDCVENSCFDATAACAEDEVCGCWLECIDAVDDPSECVAQCGDMPSTLEDVFTCVAEACADPCEV